MRILTIIILFGLFSCQERQSTTVKVEKYRHDKLIETLEYEMIKKPKDNKISIVFKESSSDTVYYFMVDHVNNREIEFMGHKCKFIDSKLFDIGGEKTNIFKYRFDVESLEDEELDFYLTTDGDILGFRELAWNGHEIFLSKYNRKILVLLTNDTTDFFKYNFRFKYL